MKKIIFVVSNIMNKIPLIFLPLYYLIFLFPRNKNIWVFGSSFGKSFTGNPKYFYIYASNIEDEIRPIWISRNEEVVNKITNQGYEAYNLYTFKGLYYALIGGTYIFDHYTKDISFWLSGGSRKLNLWHGIPFKKGHRDNEFDIVRNPRNFWDKFRWTIRRIQNEKPSHYYSVTSKINKEIWLRAFKSTDERTLTLGYPRNDIFINETFFYKNKEIICDNKNEYKKLVKLSENNKIIIYMPTHRKSEIQFLKLVNLEELNRFLLDNKIVMVFKLHQFSSIKDELNTQKYNNIILINWKEDAYPYLKISDGLITDYSSVYFDYLLTEKPVIFFSYDMDEYLRTSRKMYYDYDYITLGNIATNVEELKSKIINIDIQAKDYYYKEKYKEILDLMHDTKEFSSEKIYSRMKNV